MHRVIIPVDFSETSLTAARFAAQMLAGREDILAVIYHNYESHDDYDICHNFQETLKKEYVTAGVLSVECANDMGGDLIENISRLAKSIGATLVVMGITGKSAIRQIMFGSNTLKLLDRNQYPVLIIPQDAVYKGVHNVGFASDLKNVETTTPTALITAVLEMFNPKLRFVHVSRDPYETVPVKLEEEKNKLKEMFSRFETEFFFIAMHDFYRALDKFVKDHSIDMMITVPKHQSNSSSLFKSTHTKRLVYHSHIPILAAHE